MSAVCRAVFVFPIQFAPIIVPPEAPACRSPETKNSRNSITSAVQRGISPRSANKKRTLSMSILSAIGSMTVPSTVMRANFLAK